MLDPIANVFNDGSMDWEIVGFAALIACARVVDVTMGTMRVLFVMRGLKVPALVFGFIESAIWVIAVAKVTSRLDEPILILGFAAGFALGNYVGVSVEQRIALGHQMLRVFTRSGTEIAAKLREQGWRVTRFQGEGMAGPVDLLMMRIRRRDTPKLLKIVRSMDEKAYFVVDDVYSVESAAPLKGYAQKRNWWFSKRK
ncbi:MAG: DUF5698 domain-containing protein [Opitutales bacterium]|nr:DUF5698 domain-containing protein [Opitutales bacterium]